MMENKYVLAILCILINVVSQSLMKGGLGYKDKHGVQKVPAWAQKLGAKPTEVTIGKGWNQVASVAKNIPFAIGSLLGLFFFALWTSLISKAGLGFSNGFMALFMIAISIVSYLIFEETFNIFKIAGLAVVILGVFLLAVGESQLSS